MKTDWLKRLEHVECWHLDRDGIAHIGSPERLLIVGESGRTVLGGREGKKLCELFGVVDREELLDMVDAFNLLPKRVKKGGFLRAAGLVLRKTDFQAKFVLLIGRTGDVVGAQRPLAQHVGEYGHILMPVQSFRVNERDLRKVFKPWVRFARTGRWS